jgi:hypothetical protein
MQCLACRREGLSNRTAEGLCGPCAATQETCERDGMEFWGKISTALGNDSCCRVCLGDLTKSERGAGVHPSCRRNLRKKT